MVYILAVAVVMVVFRIIFFYSAEGTVYVKDYKTNNRAFVICSNHLSVLDPIFIVMARGWGKKLSIMGKAELFKNPIYAWVFSKVGVFPVERGAGDKAVIDKAINNVKNGHGMLIFPEGTRGGGDDMLKLKSGAFLVAGEAHADIIPCRVIYPNKDKKMKFFHRVIVKFGPPLKIEDTKLDTGSREQLRQTKAMLGLRFDEILEEYYADNHR